MNEPKVSWGQTPDDVPARWPKAPDGTPEAPVLLAHCFDSWEINLLEEKLRAYGIPVLKGYGDFGSLGKIVLGFSGSGVDLFVPASMLEDAKNLLQPVEDTELNTDTEEQ